MIVPVHCSQKLAKLSGYSSSYTAWQFAIVPSLKKNRPTPKGTSV